MIELTRSEVVFNVTEKILDSRRLVADFLHPGAEVPGRNKS